MHYTIRVDDDDRELAPDKPWAATYEGEESGIGATPQEAVADLLSQWH